MTGNLGFDISLNLAESKETDTDQRALNNLGMTPIAFDLTLFKNNRRNVSIIKVEADDIVGDTVILDEGTPFVYSNRTRITIGSIQRYIGNSNNVNSFKIYEDPQLTILDSNPIPGDYTRSDEITRENINKFVISRRPTVEIPEESVVLQRGTTSLESQNVESLVVLYRLLPRVAPTSITGYYRNLENASNSYFLERNQSLRKNIDFESNRRFSYTGFIKITDEQGRNDSSLDETNPGVFVLDATTGNVLRAFSSKENIWDDTASVDFLEAETQELVIGTLTLAANTGAELISTSIVDPTSTTFTNFTHYVPITVNGEIYSLCLVPNSQT